MAYLTCDLFSEVLQVGTSISVILPQTVEDQIGVAGTGVDGRVGEGGDGELVEVAGHDDPGPGRTQ